MQFVQTVCSVLAISQLLFTSLYLLLHQREQVLGKLQAFYCLCVIAYIIDNFSQLDSFPLLNHAASFFAILGPGVFWIICRYHLDDQPRVSNYVYLIIACYVVGRFIGVLAEGSDLVQIESLQFIFFILPNFIMLTFVLHIIYMAVQGRGDDLVEARRLVRLPLAFIMGFVLLVIVLTETLLLPNTHFNNLLFFLIFVLALAYNLYLCRGDSKAASSSEVVKSSAGEGEGASEIKTKDAKLIQAIQSAMDNDFQYREMGLSVKDFADGLGVTQHRLRYVINHQLSYRNFSQFLNHYRIAEASRRLLNEGESHLPILTIAMDAGFRSLSSFNKAFLAAHGTPPTQYRKK